MMQDLDMDASNKETLLFEDLLYLIQHPWDWDGNDELNKRQSIMIPYLLPELTSIVLSFFTNIRWKWHNNVELKLSKWIVFSQIQLNEFVFSAHPLMIHKRFCSNIVCDDRLACKYCGNCEYCYDKKCNETDPFHLFANFIYTNHPFRYDDFFNTPIQVSFYKNDVIKLIPYNVTEHWTKKYLSMEYQGKLGG